MNKRELRVSFDFDEALTIPEVAEYAKSLVEKGFIVFITTARFNELRKFEYPKNPQNQEVYDMCEYLGIPERNIVFCNYQTKDYMFMHVRQEDLIFHVDDSDSQIEAINKWTIVPCIDVKKSYWKEKCETIIDVWKNDFNVL